MFSPNFNKIDQSAAYFSSRHPKNLQNEKIFLYLEIAEIDMGGSILSREERF